MRGAVGLVLGLLVVGLAGCLGYDAPTETIQRNDSAFDAGSADLTIRVTEGHADGPPVSGATVSVYYLRPTRSDDFREVILRTDNEGSATFGLAPNRGVGISVTNGDEWTVARIDEDTTPSRGQAAERNVVLYRAEITASKQINFTEPLSGHPDQATGDYTWIPATHWFMADDAGERGYVSRVSLLEIEIAWTNGATANGELVAALSRSSDQPETVNSAENDLPFTGSHTERLVLNVDQLIEGGYRTEQLLHIGPASRWPVMAVEPLVVDVTVTAMFSERDNDEFGTPGPGIVYLLVAVLAPLAVARRRAQLSSACAPKT